MVNPGGLNNFSEDGLSRVEPANNTHLVKSLRDPGIDGMVRIQAGVIKDDWSAFHEAGLTDPL